LCFVILHVGGDQRSGRDAIFLRLIIRELVESVLLATVSIYSIVMFTDACCEPESRDGVCGLGGVLVWEVSLAFWMKPQGVLWRY
jgi:hypothetical protein